MEILITEKSKDYELLDSGEGEKLERYGEYVLRRPDPQAIWEKSLSKNIWEKAYATYIRSGTSGKWHTVASSQHLVSREETWNVTLNGLSFELKLLSSKHLGVFPEQVSQWKWLENKINPRITHEWDSTNLTNKNSKIKVLNLFGYTGGASMACARAGAEVCHVDSSKFAAHIASKNLKNSGLGEKKVRFIVDDVRKFVEREIKRGKKYDVVLMDPPVYGKGSKGEVWKIESDLLPFIKRIKNILSKNPLAIILNGYASNYSSLTYMQVLSSITKDLDGKIESGELAIKESETDRLLTAGIFARWESKTPLF